jgi:hypothetical protein
VGIESAGEGAQTHGGKVKEVVLVPTFQRNEFLYCALKRIREQDEKVKVMVFSDRGEDNEELRSVVRQWNCHLRIASIHDFYGNSFNVLEAMRWAVECKFDLIHILEDDCMPHPDWLAWYRDTHETFDDIFCACGWVFNLHAPITDDYMFAPWFYAPSSSWKRNKLALVTKHANPRYFCDMQRYVLDNFPKSILHDKGKQRTTKFFEQDGLCQFVMEQDKSQVAWRATTLIDHVGIAGYNKPDGQKFEGTLEERIAQVEALVADHYWRADIFSRKIVEREIGHILPKRNLRYLVKLPGGWSTEYVSELPKDKFPKKIHSITLPKDAEIISL